MVQRDDESLEDFVERILYNVQRDGQNNMGLYVLKIILLRGIRDDCLDMLNLLRKGDISKESFENIIELCKRYSKGSSRNNKRDPEYHEEAMGENHHHEDNSEPKGTASTL